MKYHRTTVAFVTGGGSGIGLGLARALGRRGARVALASTDSGKLAGAVQHLAAEGIVAQAVSLDVTIAGQWPAALASAEAALGPINFLALNAGIAPAPGPLEAISTDQWDWSLAVNLSGAANGIRAALPAMRASGREGHVLFTSSIAAVKLSPTMGSYAIAKAALLALAEVLRRELEGSPIGTSVVMPGATRTGLAARSAARAPIAVAEETTLRIDAMLQRGSDPQEVAEFVLDRIAEGSFYIFPHTEAGDGVRDRLAEIAAAFDHAM